MKLYDVTLPLRPGMVVWPGDPQVSLQRIEKIEDGANANVSFMGISVHTGTHVDSPYHFLSEGTTVDSLALEVLIGPAIVVELPDVIAVIDRQVIEGIHEIKANMRILFKTKNSAYWHDGKNQFHSDFVGISADGADALVALGVKLVGIDYLSIAPYKQSRPTHEVLLRAGVIAIEGLDLANVPAGEYNLFCLPLILKDTDGAPARVVLIQN